MMASKLVFNILMMIVGIRIAMSEAVHLESLDW